MRWALEYLAVMSVANGSLWIVVAPVITTVILNLASPPCL